MPLIWRDVSKEGLHPGFLADVEAFFAQAPHDFYVTEAYRSPERSAKLYAAYKAGTGPKAAPAGKSAHNFGLAIDVALDGDPKPGLQMLWNTSHKGWLWLKVEMFKHPRLKNGNTFGDWPHCEVYKWQQHTGWKGK
jgi:hypothetical protein